MIDRVRHFAQSSHFTNAIKVTVAALVPLVVLLPYGLIDAAMAMAIGALLTFPSDIPGNLRDKIKGILIAAALVPGTALFISLVFPYKWLFFPAFALSVFMLSMLSVYGNRATQVSFSGLLSVSLVFAHVYDGWELLVHSMWLFAGGLLYLITSLAFHFLRPHRYAELQLAECARLTGKYLKLRGDLWKLDANRKKITERQLRLQVELNIIHENIREILINDSRGAGSSARNRKMLVAFIAMVDVLELALSTTFEHLRFHEKFASHPKVLESYQTLAYHLGATLKRLSKQIETGARQATDGHLIADLRAFEKSICRYEEEQGEEAKDGVLMLDTMLTYARKQIEYILLAERALTKPNFKSELKSSNKELRNFLTPQDYPAQTFLENLTFSSAVFRHSLRLTITVLIGFLVGVVFPLQNAYWILLTIVVIMRPGYGLTKERSYQRIFGTVVGGLAAFGLLIITSDVIVISFLAIISMVLGFSFSGVNYKVGATFITIYVVFIFAMLTPNIADVVQYRIIDTVIGALLAFAANYLLWPAWEFLSVQGHLEKAIVANRNYLTEVRKLHSSDGESPLSYRLARKHAFVETGNLMASFQRMTQEPKSKQKHLRKIYKLAELNHTLLSSVASLANYIQTHRHADYPAELSQSVDRAIDNLDRAVALLHGESFEVEARRQDAFTSSSDVGTRIFASHLMWLNSLSQNILKTVGNLRGVSQF